LAVLWKNGPVEGTSFVVAVPLDTVEGALSKLPALNVAAFAAAVVGLIAVGRWVVRLGLRRSPRATATAWNSTQEPVRDARSAWCSPPVPERCPLGHGPVREARRAFLGGGGRPSFGVSGAAGGRALAATGPATIEPREPPASAAGSTSMRELVNTNHMVGFNGSATALNQLHRGE
jgi:hypothetical protein